MLIDWVFDTIYIMYVYISEHNKNAQNHGDRVNDRVDCVVSMASKGVTDDAIRLLYIYIYIYIYYIYFYIHKYSE